MVAIVDDMAALAAQVRRLERERQLRDGRCIVDIPQQTIPALEIPEPVVSLRIDDWIYP